MAAMLAGLSDKPGPLSRCERVTRSAPLTMRRPGPMLAGTMRIAAIESMLVDVPLREPVHGVHGQTAVQRSVLVRVRAEDGAEGWGNVDPTIGYSAVSAEHVHATVGTLAPGLI